MFFTISNWHWESTEENEELLHSAFININVQQVAVQDQVFCNPGSQTVRSKRVKASMGCVQTFLLHEKKVVVEQVGNDVW